MRWRCYLSLFVRVVFVCVWETSRKRETLTFSVSAHLYFFSEGAYCNFLRDTGWSQPSKWPIDNLGQNWKDVLSFSHKCILSVHGMCRVCAKAIWRDPGCLEEVEWCSCCQTHRKSPIILLQLISLTCIHPRWVLTYRTCRLYNNSTLLQWIMCSQALSLYRREREAYEVDWATCAVVGVFPGIVGFGGFATLRLWSLNYSYSLGLWRLN